MRIDLKGKKLLILGGGYPHCKLVERAKEMGVITYVTDFDSYEDSPAKQIADKWFKLNIYDIDRIVELCKEEGINGVINTNLDAPQKPYQQICEALDYPCFGTKEQYEILTNKRLFKKFCSQCGLDVIPEYPIELFEDEEKCKLEVQFPIVVKPTDSRGSRGVVFCDSYKEVKDAIEIARNNSTSGELIIERYIKPQLFDYFESAFIIIDGVPYATHMLDVYNGRKEDHLSNSAVAAISPSLLTDLYYERIFPSVKKFVKELELKNSLLFMQGLYDGETIRYFDPALRLPGNDYEYTYERAYGVSIPEALITFALTGSIPDEFRQIDTKLDFNGGYAFELFLPLRSGTICNVEGEKAISACTDIIRYIKRYKIGDTISELHNSSARFCEMDIFCESIDLLKSRIEWIYDTLKVKDENGDNMLISQFDFSLLDKY